MLLGKGEATETDESRRMFGTTTVKILVQGQKPAMAHTTLKQLTKPNSEPLRSLY